METLKLISVAVEKTTAEFDKLFTYKVPLEIQEKIKVGARVIVPFGRGNKKQQGLVFDVFSADDFKEKHILHKIKPIIDVVDDEPLIDSEMFAIINYLKEHTFCTYYDAVRAILPPGVNVYVEEKYVATKLLETVCLDAFTPTEQNLVKAIREAKTSRQVNEMLTKGLTPAKKSAIKTLVEKGLLEQSDVVKKKVGDSVVKMVRLNPDFDFQNTRLTKQQKLIIDFLDEHETAQNKEVCYLCAVSVAVLTGLIKKGAVVQYEKIVSRTPYTKSAQLKADDIVLNHEQQTAFDGLFELCKARKPSVSLLFGVTGSGKTQVFIKLIDSVIKAGRKVIMMVPEISLTPQMMDKFQLIFGTDVAVLHSSLSLGERLDEWKRIKSGEAKIVVGTRSAVFAPVDDIGLIIMDEEGEWSYKSETSPRYHAREVAKLRCVQHDAMLLLASATPSIESYYKAQKGVYNLFELKERYSKSKLPEVYMVDLCRNGGYNNVLSDVLIDEIYYNLEKNEQTILLLNRRGYNSIASCMECGQVVTCPNCSVALTYHKANNSMMCHYCGHIQSMGNCSECGSEHIKLAGQGTQKLEDELGSLFPNARVLRMDTDTTYSRASYEQAFEQFSKHEYDILIGTQMVAKGLDFPDVTLVGVLNADGMLYSSDFRALERTFSLVTQVVGRSGRADKPGRAFIQTMNPDNDVLNMAANQNYKQFYQGEIGARKALMYPPFCDICTLNVTATNQKLAQDGADYLVKILKNNASRRNDVPLKALGPVEAEIFKVNNKFRYRILLKCKANKAFREFIRQSLNAFATKEQFRAVSITVDINGEI